MSGRPGASWHRRFVDGPWTLAPGFVLAASLLAVGCAPKPSQELLAPTEAQLKLRSLQTRTLDVNDRQVALRAVVTVLQDLGFIIERANEPLGFVTAERFAEPNMRGIVGVTVTVRPQDDGRMMVRANATYAAVHPMTGWKNTPIEDPKVYQNFFASLQRALFITQE
jgi:hypothetical protein